MKGSGPGQFDLPHTIAIDGDFVYVGDRENVRIQLLYSNGRPLREWRDVGHAFGLFITPDHVIFISDPIAGLILKLSTDGKLLGTYGEQGRGPGETQNYPLCGDCYASSARERKGTIAVLP